MSGRGFEFGLEDKSTNPRPKFLESDIRPRVSSNLVLKLTREKKTNIIKQISRLLHHALYLNFRCPATDLKLSAEKLNLRPGILIPDRGFVSEFEDQLTFPRPRFLDSDTRPRVSSNLVLELTGQKKTNAINIHQQITAPSCLLFDFQVSGGISKTLGRGS